MARADAAANLSTSLTQPVAHWRGLPLDVLCVSAWSYRNLISIIIRFHVIYQSVLATLRTQLWVLRLLVHWGAQGLRGLVHALDAS